MFSAARPDLAGAIRELKDPSTAWSSVSFAAIALACSSAIRLRVASVVTCPSPCFRRKSEIMSAGDDSAAATPLKSSTNDSKMANSGFIYELRLAVRGVGSRQDIRHKRVEVAACEQESRQSRGLRGLDIGWTIANDKTAVAPHRPVRHQIEDHAGARLAPMVIPKIAGDRSIGMMRAIPDIVDDGVLRGEFGAHPVVQRVEIGFGKKAARHAGLIGEEEYEISGVVGAGERLCRIRHPADPVRCAHVAVIMVDDAVAVEKGRGSERDAGAIVAAHFRAPSRIRVSISSQMPWAAAR